MKAVSILHSLDTAKINKNLAMFKFNKLKRVHRAILTGMLVSLLWLQGWATSAQASPNIEGVGNSYYAQVLRGNTEPAPKPGATSDRIQAFTKCLPEELTLSNKDVGSRIARAIGEMTNDQVERAFDFTDQPSLSDAEAEFERCLQRQGITPAREATNT